MTWQRRLLCVRAVMLAWLLAGPGAKVEAAPAGTVLRVFPEKPSIGTACLFELRGEGISEPLVAWVRPSGAASAEVRTVDGRRPVPLVRAEAGRYVGLLGIDLEDPAGAWQIELQFRQGPELESREVRQKLEVLPKHYAKQTLTLPPAKVDPDADQLQRIERESAEVKALLAHFAPAQRLGPFVHPLRSRPEGGRFGSRRVINGEPKAQHSGADYKAASGTPVRALADGVVVLAADHFFAGRSVYVDHGGGFITMYFHLERIAVRKGQILRGGENVGTVGASGRVTGPHLHLGVRLAGARVNPDSVLALGGRLADGRR